MKKALTALAISILTVCSGTYSRAGYVDHRGHNVDSLETVMARWTADAMANASKADLEHLAADIRELMYGFLQTNPVKSEYYARMLLEISMNNGWERYGQQAAKALHYLADANRYFRDHEDEELFSGWKALISQNRCFRCRIGNCGPS